MAQPSLDNRLNAAPRPWIRNSQTPPKSELRYSKPSSGNSQILPKSELRYRKNSLVCSSLTPPPQARQRGRRIHRISISWRFAHRGRLEVLVAAVAIAVQEGHVWWLDATNSCYYTSFMWYHFWKFSTKYGRGPTDYPRWRYLFL